MKKITFILALIWLGLMMSGCNQQSESLTDKIDRLEKELFSDEAIFDDAGKAKARELVEAYVAQADEHPDDVKTPEYLFKAGDISMNLFDANKAIELFNRVNTTYPDYDKAPECLFLIAYIFENHLSNFGKAQELYQQFLDKYPENDFADDAEMSIKNMGKSPEELIREFEEKQQEEGLDL